MSEKNHCGYVYLLIEREFINANQPIYKIGRTGQNSPLNRLKGYPKQSQFILFYSVNNYKNIEQNIKKELKHRNEIIHKNDIGEEYFQGDINIFVSIFNQYCISQINGFTNQPIQSKKKLLINMT
jgi:hypothetical protein